MAETTAAVIPGKAERIVPTRFAGLETAPAPLPSIPPGPFGARLVAAGTDEITSAMRQVWPGGRDSLRARARGARLLLEHLSSFPGSSWQQRWKAGGLDDADRPVNVMVPGQESRKEICTGAACLFSLRVIRPSLTSLRATRFAGYGKRFLEAQRDPLLEEFWKRVQDQPIHPMHQTAALFDVAVALTTQGIALDGLTPGAFLHYIWQSRDQGLTMKARGKQNHGQFPGQLAWPVLCEMGVFPPGSPATVRAAVIPGQRSLEELVDRYSIRHQGVRQLILDYLARRRSELDYSSLDQHARSLAGAFWAKIEALSPGHPDLRIDADLYGRWREAINIRDDGQGQRLEVDRILRTVRSFYTDLHSWAVEEPEAWGPWAAPCPVPGNALRGLTVAKRRTKERIDDRIRRRQPLLPALVAHLEDRYHHLRGLLQQASPLAGDETFTLDGRSYRRIWSKSDERIRRGSGQPSVRVRDLAGGTTLNLSAVEELAFWEWAAVEVLRHSGIRIEELLELTHLSIRQYQRPNGEVIALLVIAPSKTDRERVIPMSAELFAVIAAIVRRHTADGRAIPLIQRYDQHERRMSEPMPFLFQRQLGSVRRVISPATVLTMLRRRCADLAGDHPDFSTTEFTPHDFRRLLATELVNNGIPIHIGAALLGHLNLQTTRGYVAVFNEDLVRHYQEYLDRRRRDRPADEYRAVTSTEWQGFEDHFDHRKVELGGCTRPYSAPCQHEHACLRCPMISISPTMLLRLDEIEDDLLGRRARAEAEKWLGEIEGIDLTLSFLRQKRDETRRLARVAPVDLGMPAISPHLPAEKAP